MAVYQGARLRGNPLAASAARATSAERAAPKVPGGQGRVRPTGLLIATIVAATILGLVYLTQTLGSNATTSEVAALEAKQVELRTTITRQALWVMGETEDEAVRARAKPLKLTKLGQPLVLRAP